MNWDIYPLTSGGTAKTEPDHSGADFPWYTKEELYFYTDQRSRVLDKALGARDEVLVSTSVRYHSRWRANLMATYPPIYILSQNI